MPKELSIIIDDYLFDFSKICNSLKGRRIVLEAPQGWVKYLSKIRDFLLETCNPDKVFLRLDPAYGSCDIGYVYAEAVNADTVVHIGHFEYPLPLLRSRGIQVFYVPGFYVKDIDVHVERIIECVKPFQRVSIAYVIQHKLVVDKLEALKLDKIIWSEPILGCFFGKHLAMYRRSDLTLVVGGGLFHYIGIGLALNDYSKLKVYDPYDERRQCVDLTSEIRKLLAKRLWIIQNLRGVKGPYAVIMGVKPGQYRPYLVYKLLEAAKRRGFRVDLYLSSITTKEFILNIEPWRYRAIVVASCPRLAIEDFGDFEPPVLTLGEFRMVVFGEERYWFPW